VIPNFPGGVRSAGITVAWNTTTNDLVTGCEDGSLLKWKVVIQKGEPCCARLYWGATSGSLNVTAASIRGVQGLSRSNELLLIQRGVGDRRRYFRSAVSRTIQVVLAIWRRLPRALTQHAEKLGEDMAPYLSILVIAWMLANLMVFAGGWNMMRWCYTNCILSFAVAVGFRIYNKDREYEYRRRLEQKDT
jgi:hypothetical protein